MALTDNLQAFWELDNLNDAHSTNTLTNNGSATFVAGQVGNCVDLEQHSSQYLSIADNAALSMGNIDFTVCAWVRAESFGFNRPIVGKNDSDDLEFELRYFDASTA